MVRELKIIKVPRSDKILDKNIDFPPLPNLRLDLMEIKRKLKKNLPIVSIKKKSIVNKTQNGYSNTPLHGDSQSNLMRNSDTETQKVKEEKKFIEIDTIDGGGTDEGNEIENLEGVEEEETVEGEEGEEEMVEEEEMEEGEEEMLEELGDNEGGDKEMENNGLKLQPDTSAEGTEVVDENAGKTPEQIEAEEKEEYLWRFKILKKQHKNKDIPTFSEHDDLTFMKSTYKNTIREISLDTNMDNYKTYLIGCFMGMEFVFTNFLNINFVGFTARQMLMMDKYEKMLIELGERPYNNWGVDLPIEIRLLGFILLQAGIFYLTNLIATSAGANISSLINMMTGQPTTSGGSISGNGEVVEQKKMRGPSIKIDDIKNSKKEN